MAAAERMIRGTDGQSVAAETRSWEDDDVPDFDQWCVEVDGSIECLSTRQVWMALAQGRLQPETPVWRDGLGHWVSIADVAALTEESEDDEAGITVPERSEIRARKVTRSREASRGGVRGALPLERDSMREVREEEGWLRRRWAGVGAGWRAVRDAVGRRLAQRKERRRFALDSLLGGHGRRVAVALAVCAPLGAFGAVLWRALYAHDVQVPRAQRVAIDVAERARFVSTRLRAQGVERERDWWDDRWR